MKTLLTALALLPGCSAPAPQDLLRPFQCDQCTPEIDAFTWFEAHSDECMRIRLDGTAERYLTDDAPESCLPCPSPAELARTCLLVAPNESITVWAPKQTPDANMLIGIVITNGPCADLQCEAP